MQSKARLEPTWLGWGWGWLSKPHVSTAAAWLAPSRLCRFWGVGLWKEQREGSYPAIMQPGRCLHLRGVSTTGPWRPDHHLQLQVLGTWPMLCVEQPLPHSPRAFAHNAWHMSAGHHLPVHPEPNACGGRRVGRGTTLTWVSGTWLPSGVGNDLVFVHHLDVLILHLTTVGGRRRRFDQLQFRFLPSILLRTGWEAWGGLGMNLVVVCFSWRQRSVSSVKRMVW